MFSTATNDGELLQILDLQKDNLRSSRSLAEEQEQGFVTVEHTINLLRDMNEHCQHVVAKDGEKVVGYALAMTRDFKDKIAILEPMFVLLDNLVVDGRRMGDGTYLVMGQVCVHKDYRGQGTFQGLYKKYFEIYLPHFGHIITEVAARNTRSIRAHLNVGFKEIYRYDDPGSKLLR
ncbi:MAG: GNAT family N-acetyltransferase [Saprospiraceae bacterium]|nr:GNAT family N-acetyltransferase [Saprospiraceae bacterium]